jgi:hypothetical protein
VVFKYEKKNIKYKLNNNNKNECNFFYYVNVGLRVGTNGKPMCSD